MRLVYNGLDISPTVRCQQGTNSECLWARAFDLTSFRSIVLVPGLWIIIPTCHPQRKISTPPPGSTRVSGRASALLEGRAKPSTSPAAGRRLHLRTAETWESEFLRCDGGGGDDNRVAAGGGGGDGGADANG